MDIHTLIGVLCVCYAVCMVRSALPITKMSDSDDDRYDNCGESYTVGKACNALDDLTPEIEYRWYFDAGTYQCKSFTYLGCEGNKNNFPSDEYCRQYCFVNRPGSSEICPLGGRTYVDPLTNAAQSCSGTTGSGCPANYYCVEYSDQRRYSSNVFRCCPSYEAICRLGIASGVICIDPNLDADANYQGVREYSQYPGVVSVNVTRWAFNFITGDCTSFWYNGCSGNANNFESRDRCIRFCYQAACPLGEMPMSDASTRKVVKCRGPLYPNNCPPGYSCYKSPYAQEYICCASSTMDVCPVNQLAVLQPYTNETIVCLPSFNDSCPVTSKCLQSALNDNYFYCCRKGYCPEYRSVYMSPQTGNPQACSASNAAVCGAGYMCETATGYCCTPDDDTEDAVVTVPPVTTPTNPNANACAGSGQTPYIDPTTGVPLQCDFTSHFCPQGYFCQFSPTRAQFYCCQFGGVCPNGGSGEIDPTTGTFRDCSTQLCSFGFECMSSTSASRARICCPQIVAATAGITVATSAPTRAITLAVTTAPVAVTDTTVPAVTPMAPTAAAVIQIPQLPPPNSFCPAGMTPFFYLATTTPQSCVPGQIGAGCPPGLSCERGAFGSFCCGRSVSLPAPTAVLASTACPAGSSPLVTNSGAFQLCTPGVVGCSSGFTCQQGPSMHYYCCSDSSTVSTQLASSVQAPTLVQGTIPASVTAINVCPGGSTPYLFQGTVNLQPCNPAIGGNPCSSGYSCQSSSPGGQGFCCSMPTISSADYYCPSTTSIPQRNGGGNPIACNTTAPNCSAGYSCQPAPRGGLFCCSTNLGTDECPPTFQPSLSNGLLVFCGDGTSCPNSAQCLYSNKRRQSVCCQSNSSASGSTRAPGTTATTAGVEEDYESDNARQAKDGNTVASLKNSQVEALIMSTEKPVRITEGTTDANCPVVLLQSMFTCSPGIVLSCPSPFVCKYTFAKSSYRCCLEPYQDFEYCPIGGKPVLREQVPVLCPAQSQAVNQFTYCPRDASCQITSRGFTACCMGSAVRTSQNPSVTVSRTTLPPAPILTSSASGQQIVAVQTAPSNTAANAFANSTATLSLIFSNSDPKCPERLSKPDLCDPTSAGSCPLPYVCTYSWGAQSWACCKVPDSMQCPGGGAPVFTGSSYIPCVPGTGLNGCPSDATCQYNTLRRVYMCCGRSLGGSMALQNLIGPPFAVSQQQQQPLTVKETPKPMTTQAYILNAEGETVVTYDLNCPLMMRSVNPYCLANIVNSCPPGFDCRFLAQRASFVCCKTGLTSSANNVSSIWATLTTTKPVQRSYTSTCASATNTNPSCNPSSSAAVSCPTNTVCAYSWLQQRWLCCDDRALSDAKYSMTNVAAGNNDAVGVPDCPAGQRAVANPDGLTVATCIQQLCPAFSMCRYSALRNYYICCAVLRVAALERPIGSLWVDANIESLPAQSQADNQAAKLAAIHGSMVINDTTDAKQRCTGSCTPEIVSSCSADSICTWMQQRWTCCSGLTDVRECPAGGTPRVTSTGTVEQCVAGLASEIACKTPGDTCQYSTARRQYICCTVVRKIEQRPLASGATINTVCPRNYFYYSGLCYSYAAHMNGDKH